MRLDHEAKLRFKNGKCSGNSKADRSSLAVCATTASLNGDVELVEEIGVLEWSQDGVLQGQSRQVFLEGTTVDGDLSAAFGHADTGNCILAAAGSAEILDFAHFKKGFLVPD